MICLLAFEMIVAMIKSIYIFPFFPICFRSNDNLNLGGVKNVQTISCPDLHISVPKAIPCKSKGYPLSETAAPDLHLSG